MNASALLHAEIILSGTTFGTQVISHLKTKVNWFPCLVVESGPTMSMAILLNSSVITDSCVTAAFTLHPHKVCTPHKSGSIAPHPETKTIQ